MNKITINLIIHGQTDYNKVEKIQGLTNINLNETGIKQANSFLINDINYDIGFHSSLSRSKQTMEIILKKLINKPPLYENDLLIERCYGIFEGLKKKEIELKYPELYKNWLKNENVFIKDAKSIESVINRMIDFLNILVKNKYKNVIVVTHSGVLYALYKLITKSKISERPDIKFDNCSSNILEVSYDTKISNLKFHINGHTYEHCGSPTKMIIPTS